MGTGEGDALAQRGLRAQGSLDGRRVLRAEQTAEVDVDRGAGTAHGRRTRINAGVKKGAAVRSI